MGYIAGNGGNRFQWKVPFSVCPECFPNAVGGVSNDRHMGWGVSEGLVFSICILGFLNPIVSNHISKVVFCQSPLCTFPKSISAVLP